MPKPLIKRGNIHVAKIETMDQLNDVHMTKREREEIKIRTNLQVKNENLPLNTI